MTEHASHVSSRCVFAYFVDFLEIFHEQQSIDLEDRIFEAILIICLIAWVILCKTLVLVISYFGEQPMSSSISMRYPWI